MKTRLSILPLIAAAALLATACSDGDTFVDAGTNQTFGISVSGTGRAVGAPDIAILTLGVSAERPALEPARAAAATAQKAVIDSLKANAVAEKDIQTVQFNVQPQYDSPGRQQVLRGYRVSNVVRATLRKVDTAGKVIDDAVAAGGNAVVVNGISFSIDDPTEMRAEARAGAVADARAKAEQLARASNLKLGRAISISEGGAQPLPFARAATSLAAEASTPIEPGELQVSVTVSVLYAIESD